MSIFFVRFTETFFKDRKLDKRTQMMENTARVYACVILNEYRDLVFAVPQRSNISNSRAGFPTPANADRPAPGFDFQKAIVIPKDEIFYWDGEFRGIVKDRRRAKVEPLAFHHVMENQGRFVMGLNKFINSYVRALRHPAIPFNNHLIKCCAFQYFGREMKSVIEAKCLKDGRKETNRRMDSLFKQLELQREQEKEEKKKKARLRPLRNNYKEFVNNKNDRTDRNCNDGLEL